MYYSPHIAIIGFNRNFPDFVDISPKDFLMTTGTSQNFLLKQVVQPRSVGQASGALEGAISVSHLVAQLKKDVEQKHRSVCVVGELSSFKKWRSGHCYFDIKDDKSLIPAVMFRPHFERLMFAVDSGLKVVITGKISVYAPQSRLQLIAENMEPVGQGALALAFEQLKDKLKAQGLFDDVTKQTIKAFNTCVGIVTSSHGAVLRDMVRIIKTRMPQANILFMDARVQGVGAKESIAQAIAMLDNTGMCDVMIVGRGGGSLEDLWAFNEEMVAHAICAARTPIISAVGHETDTTIADYVADVRAATPTHAAQLAAAKVDDLLLALSQSRKRLAHCLDARIKAMALKLAQEKRRLLDPRIILFRHAQVLDEYTKNLNEVLARRLKASKTQLQALSHKLSHHAPFRRLRLKQKLLSEYKSLLSSSSPKKRLVAAANDLAMLDLRLKEIMRTKLSAACRDFEQGVVKLSALSPLDVLKRGFAIIESKQSARVITQKSQLSAQEKINIRLQDGVVHAQIIDEEN